MAGVFLSYDRDDTEIARRFAHVLEKAGHSVWWDLHVRGGAQFSKVIEEALKAADVVVVLWSANSIESAWVRDEAAAGRDSARLVPVTIDGTQAPLGFRQFQTVDLSRWKGHGRPSQLEMFLADVDAVVASGKGPPTVKTASPAIRPRPFGNWWVVLPFAAIGLIAGLLLWQPWSSSPIPAVLVTAGRNDAASQVLARDLTVQLARLPEVKSGSLRLATSNQPSSERPTLVFEVTSLGQAQSWEAGVLLKSAADDAIVWSQNFEQGQRSADDMRLQMALTAGRVLGCENDVLAEQVARLSEQSRTLYLQSCAQTIEGGNYDPQPVILGLTKVVAQAPKFTAAWRKLLVAESELVKDNPQPTAAERENLRRHIAAARRLDPHMPEATIAESSLVPPADLSSRMRLVEQAYKEDPGNVVVLMRKTELLQKVGRMGQAVGTALGGILADPMSPEVLNNYISALAYSGQTDMAEQQLKRAERMWRGTSTLEEIEGRYYFRIGDPKIALQMSNDQPSLTPSQLLFMQARANPTNENVGKLISFYTSRLNGNSSELPALHFLSQAFAQFHRENELYNIVLHWPNHEELAENTDIWFRPVFHQFRRDPRFIQLAARTQLLSYWRTTGEWPDFCFEPDLSYDCKKEAAKLSA